MAAAVAIGDHPLESIARNTLGTTLVIGGDEDDGLAELARAGQLIGADRPTPGRATRRCGVPGRVRYHLNYSDALHSTGHYEDALQQALTGVEAARAVRDRTGFRQLRGRQRGGVHAALGRLDAAAALIEQVMRLDPPTMSVTHLASVITWLAALARRPRCGRTRRRSAAVTDRRRPTDAAVGGRRDPGGCRAGDVQPAARASLVTPAVLPGPRRALRPGAQCSGARGRGRRRHRTGPAGGGRATGRGAAGVGPGRRGRAAGHPDARGLDAADRRRARGRTGGVGARRSPRWPETRPRRRTWCRTRSCAGPAISPRPGSARPPVPS